MAFESIGNQLQYIANKGNYSDLVNTMALISSFGRTYLTGRVPTMRRVRGTKEDAAVAGLQSSFLGATHQSNSIQDFNMIRDSFFEVVALVNPAVYGAVDAGLLPRMGIVATPGFPVNVNDCQGNLIGAAANLPAYLTLWNDQKVALDNALCEVSTPYLFDTGVAGYLGESAIQPDNTKIRFNTPSVTTHTGMPEVNAVRREITAQENQVSPKSIATYTENNL